YLGVLILIPQFAFIVLGDFSQKRKLLLWAMAGVATVLPWIVYLGTNLAPSNLAQKIVWISRPGFKDVVRFYVEIFGWLNISGSTRYLLLVFCMTLSSIVFAKSLAVCDRKLLATFAAMAVLGPVVAFVVSRWGPISIWASRQLIGSAIFMFCLLGIGLSIH